jgi:hypothetical protein
VTIIHLPACADDSAETAEITDLTPCLRRSAEARVTELRERSAFEYAESDRLAQEALDMRDLAIRHEHQADELAAKLRSM